MQPTNEITMNFLIGRTWLANEFTYHGIEMVNELSLYVRGERVGWIEAGPNDTFCLVIELNSITKGQRQRIRNHFPYSEIGNNNTAIKVVLPRFYMDRPPDLREDVRVMAEILKVPYVSKKAPGVRKFRRIYAV